MVGDDIEKNRKRISDLIGKSVDVKIQQHDLEREKIMVTSIEAGAEAEAMAA